MPLWRKSIAESSVLLRGELLTLLLLELLTEAESLVDEVSLMLVLKLTLEACLVGGTRGGCQNASASAWFWGIIGGCQKVLPDPRKAGPWLILPLGPNGLKEKSMLFFLEWCDGVDAGDVYPSPLLEELMLLPLYELYEAADEGGSVAESVLILLRLFERGLMLGSVSVVVSTLENGNGSEFKPYSCIK
jgi:hypothetical protein